MGNKYKHITNSLRELAQSDPEIIKSKAPTAVPKLEADFNKASKTFDCLEKYWLLSILNELCFISYCMYALLVLIVSRPDKYILLVFNSGLIFQTVYYLKVMITSCQEVCDKVSFYLNKIILKKNFLL